MESTKFILVLFLSLMFLSPSISQVNISFDPYCPNKNCAIIADAFIKSLGNSFVNMLLEKEKSIGIVLKIDTLGRVINIIKIRSDVSFPKSDIKRIKQYLIKSDTRFYICFEPPYDGDKKRSYDLIIRTTNSIKNNNVNLFTGFPGELMMYYELDSVCSSQSRLEYLKRRIKKYLDK